MPTEELTPQQKAARTKARIRMFIIILTVLVVDLVAASINAFITSLSRFISPYLLTAIGMIIVVILFYPALEFLNRMTNWVLEATIGFTSNIIDRKRAVTLIFVFFLVLLYIAFFAVWFQKFLPTELWSVLFKAKPK
jgi:hypothetical protein